MPRVTRLWRYDVLTNGQRLSEAVAVVVYRADRVHHWHAIAEQEQILEEGVARELFPSVQGRYDTPMPFALKPEDQPEVHTHGSTQTRYPIPSSQG